MPALGDRPAVPAVPAPARRDLRGLCARRAGEALLTPREEALDRLASVEYDLLVVGAGIIGARVAYEAAHAGMSVALVDGGDFGGGTSSASSKLIHGGLRYLPQGHVVLVREAHLERRALLGRLAPHLVRKQLFLLPVYRGGPHGAASIAAGLLLYAGLSGFREARGRMVSPDRARQMVPPIRTEGLRSCGLYADAQTNDARLTLATVQGAAASGATVLNHAPVTGFEASGGRVIRARLAAPEGDLEVRFRSAVNATGPWLDTVRRLEAPGCAPAVRLSKGVHVLLPQEQAWGAALTVPLAGGRVSFAIPWEGMLMLGTTDTPYDGHPSDAHPDPEDVDAILREAAIGLDPAVLDPGRIRFAFAGLRALPRGEGSTSEALREHVVSAGPGGMVSVAGGKLTTHRRIARDVLRRLEPRPQRLALSADPLPGAGARPEMAGLEPALADHLWHLYGTAMEAVVAPAREDPSLLEPIAPGGPDIWAQVGYAARSEWAVTVDDVLRRRTTVAIRGLVTPALEARVAAEIRGAHATVAR